MNSHRNDDYEISESAMTSFRPQRMTITGQRILDFLRKATKITWRIFVILAIITSLSVVGVAIYWTNAPFFANCVPLSNKLPADLVLPRFTGKRFNNTLSGTRCKASIDNSFYSTIGGLSLPSVSCEQNPLSQSCAAQTSAYCSSAHPNKTLCSSVDSPLTGLNRSTLLRYIGECSWSTDNAFGTHNTYQIDGSVLRILTDLGVDIPGKRDFYETHPPLEDLLAAGNRAFELDIHNCGDNNVCTFHAPFEENVYHKCTETYLDIISAHLKANPSALVKYVWLDTKTLPGRSTCKGTVNTMQLVQNTILRSINISQILTPFEIFPPECDQFLNITFDSPHHLLLECVSRYGLPTLDSVRGRVVFIASFSDDGTDCYEQFRQIPFTRNIMFLRKADMNSLFQQVEFNSAVHSLESLIDVQSNEMLRVNLASYENLTLSLVANVIQSHDHMAYNLYSNATLIDLLGDKYVGFKGLGLIGPEVFRAFDMRNYSKMDCLLATNCESDNAECVADSVASCA